MGTNAFQGNGEEFTIHWNCHSCSQSLAWVHWKSSGSGKFFNWFVDNLWNNPEVSLAIHNLKISCEVNS